MYTHTKISLQCLSYVKNRVLGKEVNINPLTGVGAIWCHSEFVV